MHNAAVQPSCSGDYTIPAVHVDAQVMCDKYRQPLEAEFDGKVGVVELSLLDKTLFVVLRNWIERNLKKDVPASRHVCVTALCTARLPSLVCGYVLVE